MSNRFHNKWHRRNHHTYGNPWNPDASHDPIASVSQPFLGEFILFGSLSCIAPPSAYAAHLYCDNTALCAWAGKRGAYIFTHGYMGAEIHGSTNIGISAYAPIKGLEVASNVRAITAFSHYIGADIYSNNIAISAYAPKMGIEVASNIRAISAFSHNIGADIYSNNIAISAYAENIGADIYSRVRAISAYGDQIGLDVYSHSKAISAYSNNIGIEVASEILGLSAFAEYIGTEIYSDNKAISAFAEQIGAEIYSNNRSLSSYAKNIGLDVASEIIALSAYGKTIGAELYSNNRAISAYGLNIGLDVASEVRAISAYGEYIGADIYSNNTAISAFAEKIGTEIYSNNRSISAYSKNIGLDVASEVRALSAYGKAIGAELYSNNTAISAYGMQIGLDIYSLNTAISSYSPLTGIKLEAGQVGASIYSPTIALSTGGGGVNIFNNPIGIFTSPSPKPTYFNGGFPALDVKGNTYIDGNATITGNLSALGTLSYLDTKVLITSSFRVENTGTDAAGTFVQTGAYPILACYDNDVSGTVPSLIVDGATNGWIGIGTSTPTNPFNIVKSTASSQGNNQPQIRISDDNTTTKVLVTTPITNYARCSIGTETSHSFDIVTNATTRHTVLTTGQVGINTTAPGANNLNVNGTANISTSIDTATLNATTVNAAINNATGNSTFSNSVRIGGSTAPTSILTVQGPIATNAPTTITGTTYSVTSTDSSLIFNTTATCTVTLPTASNCSGRWLYIKNIAAFLINSNASNVIPRATNTAGSTMLTNTAGAWAWLQSNGTNWVVMAGN